MAVDTTDRTQVTTSAGGAAPGRLNRRSALALLAAALASSACRNATSPELSAGDVLSKSSEALARVKSVHFTLTSENGMMAIGTGLVAKTIEGDVIQPDRLKGQATSTFGRLTVQIGFIEVGDKKYVTNPITKQWQEIPGGSAAPNLLDPARGAPAALKQAANPRKLANVTVGGVDCYHVTGQISSSLVAGLVGLPGTGAPLASDLWVGTSDLLPRQISLAGPVTTNEPPEIKRSLVLSHYDEQITIEPPG